MKAGIGGPFLQMAVFCERVLQEKDGVLSAVRIVDRFTQSSSSAETPLKIDITILIGLKSGDIRGKKQLKITPRAPSGQKLHGFSGPVILEGADQGAAIAIRYLLEAKKEGLYWFDVELDGQLLTKMPLRIIFHKTVITSTTTPPAH